MNKITLYTLNTCHRCKTIKHMLDAHSVQYNEVTDKDLMVQLELIEVPAIEVDGKIIDEYPSVLTWLEKNGYYSPEVIYND